MSLVPWTTPGNDPCCCGPLPCPNPVSEFWRVTANFTKAQWLQLYAGGNLSIEASASVDLSGEYLGEDLTCVAESTATLTKALSGGCDSFYPLDITQGANNAEWVYGADSGSSAATFYSSSLQIGLGRDAGYYGRFRFNTGIQASKTLTYNFLASGGVAMVPFDGNHTLGSGGTLSLFGQSIETTYRAAVLIGPGSVVVGGGSVSVSAAATLTPFPP